MIDINYELYKVFYHVASTLNFSEASKQLYISQSAVSQSIKTLERKLDQTLFIRSTKKVQLTPEGETSMKCAELLRNGLVDLTVVNFPNNHLGTTTSVMRIKKFRDVFIAGNTFQKLKGETLTFSQLLKYPILMLDKNSTTNEFLHQVFQQHQLDLVPEIELTSNDLLIDLARIGLGIAFVPDYCISPDSEDVFILHTKEELPERELAIAYNEHLPLSRASMEFLSYFRDKTC